MHCVSSVSAKRYSNNTQNGTRLVHMALAAAVLALGTNLAWAQTLPLVVPATAPTTLPAPMVTLAHPTTAPATTALAETPAASAEVKAFVGAITSDHVYVRSGPGQTFYELGKLNKGDLVKVVGQQAGWNLIAPPAGTICYLAKEFVALDATGKIGTTNTDFVRVRAASARLPAADYAVLTVVRKGTTLTVLATSEKYYTIVAPEKAYVFVHPQFIKATTVAYAEPTLQLPTGPAPVTPRVAATSPTATADDTTLVVRTPTTPTTEPATQPAVQVDEPAETHKVVIVPPQPSKNYNGDAETRFNSLNGITQAEFQKPLLQRDMPGLLKDWQQLAALPNLSPWIKDSCAARIETIEKWARIQQLAKEGNLADDVAFQEKRAALQQEWKATELKIAELQRSSPPLAEGELRTSNIVNGKYALVDPSTGRVRAYITPSGEIDFSKLLGKNVAVYGTFEDETVPVKTIKVKGVRTFDLPAKAPATQP